MNKQTIKLLEELNLLYVEDEKKLQSITAKMLNKLFNKVDLADNGKEGLELYKNNSYDIVITDINMPDLDGLEMSKEIRKINHDAVIIITSAYSDSAKLLETIKLGLDSYLIKPIDMEQFISTLHKVAINIKNKKENEYYKKNLEQIIKSKVEENIDLEVEKIKNYEETIIALINMVEIRDSYTSGHSQRVAQYSRLIAEEMNLDDLEVKKIHQAGILHDIGKIAIPDSILLKPARLNEREFNLMKKHALMSYQILEKIPMYKNFAIYVKYHHERYDGSGYPDGLKGEEIPLLSQIMAISDTFDAMTTSRIYKPRKDKNEAIAELATLVNISFSENIVNTAIKVFQNIDIDTTVNQNPLTEFEEQRFSFFYKDKLTDLYNTEYLDLLLSTNFNGDNYEYMTIVNLHNFGEVNRLKSWEIGNNILIDFSNYLKENFISNSLIFRFRGDDFILLDKDEFKLIDITKLEDYNITIDIQEINIKEKNITSYSRLKEEF